MWYLAPLWPFPVLKSIRNGFVGMNDSGAGFSCWLMEKLMEKEHINHDLTEVVH